MSKQPETHQPSDNEMTFIRLAVFKKSDIGRVMSYFEHVNKHAGTCNMTRPAPRARFHTFAQVFRRRWIKWVVAFALLPWNSASAQAIADGYTSLGNWAPSLVSTEYGPYSADTATIYSWGWKLSAWPTLPQEADGAVCNKPGLPYKAIDGWTGYEIQPGVLLILTGNLTASAITASPSATTDIVTDKYSATWDSKGALTADWLNPGVSTQCAGIKRTVSDSFYSLAGGHTSMNVTYGVYVSPTAASGPLPTTYLQLFKTSGNNERSVLTLSGLTVARMECSLDTASLVPFGDVTPGQAADGKGVAVQSSLNVNCTNEAGTSAAITYSVTPKSKAGDKYTLPMISTVGGGIAGDIRGFLGANAATEAGCTDRASSLQMDSTQVALRRVNSSESWSDPLVWVLCPRITAQPGPATAAATIEINW